MNHHDFAPWVVGTVRGEPLKKQIGGWASGRRWFPTMELAMMHHYSTEGAAPACWVYFIVPRGKRKVKIGYSVNPASRLSSLQSGATERLDIVAKVPGDKVLEKALHAEFAADRISGEWFTLTRPLQARIRSLEKDWNARRGQRCRA